MKIIYENCRLKNYMKEYKCNNLLSYNIFFTRQFSCMIFIYS